MLLRWNPTPYSDSSASRFSGEINSSTSTTASILLSSIEETRDVRWECQRRGCNALLIGLFSVSDSREKSQESEEGSFECSSVGFQKSVYCASWCPKPHKLERTYGSPYCCPTRVSKPKKLPETVRLRLMMTSCHRASAKTHWKISVQLIQALVYIEHTHLGPRNLTWTNCPQVMIMLSRVNQRKHI